MKVSISRGSQLTAVLLTSALALSACGSGSGSDSGGTTLSKETMFATGFVGTSDAGTPKQGGTLTIADYSEPKILNPAMTYANGASGGSPMAAIYDELMRYDYKTNKYVPQLAESLTPSNNNTVWTLKLRDGVKFTNGEVLDSSAVVKSIGYYESLYGYESNLLLESVASTTTPDAKTVVFTLRSPWSDFPDILASGPGMIMAPAAYKSPKPADFQPIGAGPFKLGSYAPGESLVLNANSDYVLGKPYLDSLKFIWPTATDDQVKLTALKDGSADVAYLRNPEVVTKARKAGQNGFMYSVGAAELLAINTRAGRPGADLNIRRAIDFAIDANAYVNRVSKGAALATKGLFGPGSAWYTPASPNYDVAKATALVTEAKAKGYDGHLTLLTSASASAQGGAVLLKAMLDKVGFSVTLDSQPTVAAQMGKLYRTHEFDIGVASNSVTDVDPWGMLDSNMGARSFSNLPGWSSPESTALLAQLQANGTPSTGKAIMDKIQKLVQDQVPNVNLSAAGIFEAWNTNVHGIQPTAQTMVLFAKAWKS